jgi:8-hydroxy-5-deazaflavin:NADPH oxidoreductase
MTTAIIGIGNIGGTLARELAAGGEAVVLSASRPAVVQKLAAEIGPPTIAASSNRDAVQPADAVIFALWLGPMKTVIDEVADLLPGKLVVDPSNPISISAEGTVSRTLPEGQSAGEVVASWLPQGTRFARRSGWWRPRCFRRVRVERQSLQFCSTRPTTTGRRPRSSA